MIAVAGAATGAALTVAVLSEPARLEPSSPSASDRPFRVELLVERFDCWTGDAPDPDVIPGHAIVTLPGQVAKRVPSDVGFGIWLDGDPGVLHAFCP